MTQQHTLQRPNQTIEQFEARLKRFSELFTPYLARCLAPPKVFSAFPTLYLNDALRAATLSQGKRLRPFLVVETASLFDVPVESMLPIACSVELIHCYSLVHDDLPSMDDDDLRRGQKTIHKAYDEATAILTGDALQCLAFELLSSKLIKLNPEITINLMRILSTSSGICGMIGGQYFDLAAEGRFGKCEFSFEQTMLLQRLKTGALLEASIDMGAVAGGATTDERQRLKEYGQCLGEAFQIADDLLDTESSPEVLGKATQKDQEAGKATSIDYLGREGAKLRMHALADQCLSLLKPWEDRADGLREAALYTIMRRQ